MEEEAHGKTVESVRHSRGGRGVPGKEGKTCAPLYSSFMWESLRVPQQATLPQRRQLRWWQSLHHHGSLLEILGNSKRKDKPFQRAPASP